MSHHSIWNSGGGRNFPSFSKMEGVYISSRGGQVCERGLLNTQSQYPAPEIPYTENSWRLGYYSGEVSDILALFLLFPKNQAAAIITEKMLRNTGLVLKCSFYG